MSVFDRTSKVCDLGDISPALADALTRWAAERGFAPLLESVLVCCETVSTRQGAAGIYGRMSSLPRTVVTGALLTHHWLVWATIADEGEPQVTAVSLPDCTVVDYRESADYRRIVDSGLQVCGRIGDKGEETQEETTVFLGLGEDQAGAVFLRKVLEAAEAARR